MMRVAIFMDPETIGRVEDIAAGETLSALFNRLVRESWESSTLRTDQPAEVPASRDGFQWPLDANGRQRTLIAKAETVEAEVTPSASGTAKAPTLFEAGGDNGNTLGRPLGEANNPGAAGSSPARASLSSEQILDLDLARAEYERHLRHFHSTGRWPEEAR